VTTPTLPNSRCRLMWSPPGHCSHAPGHQRVEVYVDATRSQTALWPTKWRDRAGGLQWSTSG
jgi:hypothetical protein